MHGSLCERLFGYIAYGTSSPLIIALGLLELLILLLRSFCMMVGWYVLMGRYTGVAVLMGLFIVLCTAITGFDGCFRFRMAFEPLAVMLSMGGLVYMGAM